MPPITIYTKMYCPYCDAAKDLLRKKNAVFDESPDDGDAAAQRAMAPPAGGRATVPQIFVGERHVGGCDDLYGLDHAGGLDALLGA